MHSKRLGPGGLAVNLVQLSQRLGPDAALAGPVAFVGLQAKGLLSGAAQVPVTVPRWPIKVQACPLVSDLHAASASAGGVLGPLPPAG
jgi:hypothetical protein